MLRPSSEQRALLTGVERYSFALCEFANLHPIAKRIGHLFLAQVGARWVHLCTRNLMVTQGLEGLQTLAPERGILLCANHRSFFDQYVLSQLIFQQTRLCNRAFFPVRSEFFYDRWVGLAVNGVMSAWSMFPPILRQPERNAFNRFSIDFLADALQTPGTMVGFHPEGTRNKTATPYALLPAHPGVGQLVMKARPLVIPAFIMGLSNDLFRQVRANFSRRGEPIIAIFGKPMDLGPLLAKPARLRSYMEVSNAIREAIAALGQEELRLRNSLRTAPLSAVPSEKQCSA